MGSGLPRHKAHEILGLILEFTRLPIPKTHIVVLPFNSSTGWNYHSSAPTYVPTRNTVQLDSHIRTSGHKCPKTQAKHTHYAAPTITYALLNQVPTIPCLRHIPIPTREKYMFIITKHNHKCL